MIRPATEADIPAMIRMGIDFHRETPWSKQCVFDEESFRDTVLAMLGSGAARVFIAEDKSPVGMAAIVMMPAYFNRHHTIAQELFCWVDPEYRGHGTELYDAIEQWAHEAGAKCMIVSLIPNVREDAMTRLYRARGFERTDSFFTKALRMH